MEDCIYFVIGVNLSISRKSKERAGEWYEWTERSKNTITRTSFNKKSMIWITQVMREASKMKGNVVRRWKKIEPLRNLLCKKLQQIR
ncbi:hypothetical protein KY284_021869 [Solanum tuberosum]|nr:hypothetical protein KY284_021869 [Solanum tuberosum]